MNRSDPSTEHGCACLNYGSLNLVSFVLLLLLLLLLLLSGNEVRSYYLWPVDVEFIVRLMCSASSTGNARMWDGLRALR